MYLDIYEEEAYIEYQGNLDFLDEPFFIDTWPYAKEIPQYPMSKCVWLMSIFCANLYNWTQQMFRKVFFELFVAPTIFYSCVLLFLPSFFYYITNGAVMYNVFSTFKIIITAFIVILLANSISLIILFYYIFVTVVLLIEILIILNYAIIK